MLTQEQIAGIRTSSKTQSELADIFGVSQGTISNVLNFRGPYSIQAEVRLTPKMSPLLSEKETAEKYGAIDIEDIELGLDEIINLRYKLLDVLDTAIIDGEIPIDPKINADCETLSRSNYLIKREDPKGHKWVVTELGIARHSYECHRRELGLIQDEMVEEVSEQKPTKSSKQSKNKSHGIFSPEFEKRLGDQIDRLLDHICGL